jgi:diguanylate cyclase (GGDEF)-like protein
MSFQFPAINYLYLLASVLALVIGIGSRGKLVDRTAMHWLGVLFSFALWSAGELLANIGTTLEWQLAFQRVVYLGVVCGVVFWLLFAIHYAGFARWLTPLVTTLVLVIPTMTLLLVATLESHSLFYESTVLVLRDNYWVLEFEYGIAFWVQILLCSYLYTVAGSVLLVRASLQQPAIYRRQSTLIAIAAVFPLVANVLYVLDVDFSGGFDPTSLFFVFSAMLISVATRHYHFLRLSPIARDLVFRNINIGVVVLNTMQRISDVNPIFARIAGSTTDELVGVEADEVFAHNFDCTLLSSEAQRWEGRVSSLQTTQIFDVSSVPIQGYQGENVGTLVLLNDVTQIQQAMTEIRRLADTDLLTQLPNRRGLMDWVADVPQLDTMFQPALVVMADLDHFKELNDSHGHHCGDYILQEVARIIARRLGSGDNVARWGGEEFCIVMTRLTRQQGEEFLENLRSEIEGFEFTYESARLHVTMTFGLVERLLDEPLELAIKRADLLMYEGKRLGRNRVLSMGAGPAATDGTAPC